MQKILKFAMTLITEKEGHHSMTKKPITQLFAQHNGPIVLIGAGEKIIWRQILTSADHIADRGLLLSPQ